MLCFRARNSLLSTGWFQERIRAVFTIEIEGVKAYWHLCQISSLFKKKNNKEKTSRISGEAADCKLLDIQTFKWRHLTSPSTSSMSISIWTEFVYVISLMTGLLTKGNVLFTLPLFEDSRDQATRTFKPVLPAWPTD